MQKQLIIGLFAATCFIVVAGCGSSSSTSSPAETKSFAGGPMPADAAEKFKNSMHTNAAPAGAAEKAKADAMNAKKQ